MSSLINLLRSLDRKERFAVLRETLGLDADKPRFDRGFRKRLEACIGASVPENAFLAMDYHLDWIELALHLMGRPDVGHGYRFENPNLKAINHSQQDIDLLVAFPAEGRVGSVTHLVLIEAKAYLHWTNKQLREKARRLRGMFGEEGTNWELVVPHFVMMTERKSDKISSSEWPGWMKRHDEPPWLLYDLPPRYEVMRCTGTGRRSKKGRSLQLRAVPRR